MPEVGSSVAAMQTSLDMDLQNLVRFGTQEQADQAHAVRERLRLAQMEQALASLESRNAAILQLVSSLETIVDTLKRHPLGDALDRFRNALADGEMLLDRIQGQLEESAEEAAAPAPSPPKQAPAAPPPTPAPARPPEQEAVPPAPPRPPSEPAGEPLEPSRPSPAPVSPPTGEPTGGQRAGAPPPSPTAEAATSAGRARDTEAEAGPDLKLSAANETFRAALLKAAHRCALAPSALAALIDAEAARLPNGGWNPRSANPRSSARGLTQFLSATWIGMATRAGTFLNEIARSRGFVDARDAVVSARRGDLLDLRFDPEASIVTAADFAKQNLDFLASKGCIPAAATDDDKARLAYLAHHEGPGGARDFLKGTLSEDRAERLLRINAGAKAGSLHGMHGSWRAAYVTFLNDYIDRKIRPERFRA